MSEIESETTRALRAARMIAFIGAGVTLGMMFAASRIAADLVPWVTAIGLFITAFLAVAVVWNERANSNWRANKRMEIEHEHAVAETEKVKAQRALIEAKRDYIEYKTRVLGQSATGATRELTSGDLPPMNAGGDLRIYRNGVLVNGDEQGAQPMDDPDDQVAPAQRPTYQGALITETVDERRVRIRRLAQEIWAKCRGANPTQDNIKAQIAMSRGGLLRSNQDITDALDDLAREGLVTPQAGQGVPRLWISQGTREPIDYRAYTRARTREGVQ